MKITKTKFGTKIEWIENNIVIRVLHLFDNGRYSLFGSNFESVE